MADANVINFVNAIDYQANYPSNGQDDRCVCARHSEWIYCRPKSEVMREANATFYEINNTFALKEFSEQTDSYFISHYSAIEITGATNIDIMPHVCDLHLAVFFTFFEYVIGLKVE